MSTVQRSAAAPLSPQANQLKKEVSDLFACVTRVLTILDENPGTLAEIQREIASHLTGALKLRLMQLFL